MKRRQKADKRRHASLSSQMRQCMSPECPRHPTIWRTSRRTCPECGRPLYVRDRRGGVK